MLEGNQEGFRHHVENPKTGGRPTKDFSLTVHFAKHLAMMARTEEGKNVRDYFIACEQAAQAEATQGDFSGLTEAITSLTANVGSLALVVERLGDQLTAQDDRSLKPFKEPYVQIRPDYYKAMQSCFDHLAKKGNLEPLQCELQETFQRLNLGSGPTFIRYLKELIRQGLLTKQYTQRYARSPMCKLLPKNGLQSSTLRSQPEPIVQPDYRASRKLTPYEAIAKCFAYLAERNIPEPLQRQVERTFINHLKLGSEATFKRYMRELHNQNLIEKRFSGKNKISPVCKLLPAPNSMMLFEQV